MCSCRPLRPYGIRSRERRSVEDPTVDAAMLWREDDEHQPQNAGFSPSGHHALLSKARVVGPDALGLIERERERESRTANAPTEKQACKQKEKKVRL